MANTSFNKQELTDITELLGRGLNDIKQQNKEGNASIDGDTDDDLKERDRLEASGQHLVKKLSEMETRLSPKPTDQGKHYMATPHEQRRANTLRLIALSTNDPLARTVALNELGESEGQARHELSQTCWADDMSNLRTAAEANFKSK